MRVGWLPGRQADGPVLCAATGLEVVPLQAGVTAELPEVVVLDRVEAEVFASWVRLPIALIVRGTGHAEPEEAEALVFDLPADSAPDDLLHAVRHASAALRRVQQLRRRVADLQRRLADRILVEKAKGILTQRFGLSEDEAYRRLRLQSRQERRPMREIAEALLTSLEVLPLEPAGHPG